MSALKICPQCGTEYELDQRFCPKDGSTLKSQNAGGDLVGSIIADRYHVLKKLGEGGMGAVYLAEHVKMGRKSAVKVMNPGMASDPDAISRFNREAANASRINHPNVCAVYDFGETGDGLIYLAMEFIEGPSLSSVIEDLGALPPLRAADITRQAADALSVAHEMGIVHRDLKPDNIMIARGRDGADLVKVVDFGIAKAANVENQKVTKTGMVVGTPEYMSPEQLAGDKLDGRSDTYSLALVAFNMLTGRLPFPADTLQESMILRLTDLPKTLSEMKPDVSWPDAVQAVLNKALARSAPERYQTAADFGRDLYRAIQAMPESEATNAFTAVMAPVAAPPGADRTAAIPATRVNTPTPMKGSPPAAQRSRVPVLVGAAAALLALGGGGAWLATRGGGDASAAAPITTLSQPTAPASPPVTQAAARDYDAELAAIAKLTEVNTEASAAAALLKLDSIPVSSLTIDQKVQAALLRAEALTTRGSVGAACLALQDVQGASRGTKYERSVNYILQNAC